MQHYDRRGQYDIAVTKIDEAIEHTPTVIDLYSVKVCLQHTFIQSSQLLSLFVLIFVAGSCYFFFICLFSCLPENSLSLFFWKRIDDTQIIIMFGAATCFQVFQNVIW